MMKPGSCLRIIESYNIDMQLYVEYPGNLLDLFVWRYEFIVPIRELDTTTYYIENYPIGKISDGLERFECRSTFRIISRESRRITTDTIFEKYS